MMKNNYRTALFYLFFLVINIIGGVFTPINIDTTFNFEYVHLIKNGALPYRDINMITTPLFHLISVPFLYIYDGVFTFHVLSAVIGFSISVMAYKTANQLSTSQTAAIIIGSGTGALSSAALGWNYNAIILLLTMCGAYIILKDQDLPLLLGTFSAVGILCKQSYGAIAFLSMYLAYVYTVSKRIGLKKAIKRSMLFIPPMIIGAVLLIVYLASNNIFSDFRFLCVEGIWDFNGVNDIRVIAFTYIITSLIYITWLYPLKNTKLNVCCIFMFVNILGIYPLPNISHMLGSFVFAQYAMYYFANTFKSPCGKNLGTGAFASAMLFVFVCNRFGVMTQGNIVWSGQKYFSHCLISKTWEDDIEGINKNIRNHPDNNYHIITETAISINMNRTETFDKYYSLLFDGNLGKYSSKELVESRQGDYFIVYSNPKRDFHQICPNTLDFIRNMKYIEDVGSYSIYYFEEELS